MAGEYGQRRHTRTKCIRRVHHVERGRAAVRVFAHYAVVVIRDSALGNAGQEHGRQQPDRRAVGQQHDKADREYIIQDEVRAFESPFDGSQTGQQADAEISDRLRGQQRTADLVIQRVGRA